MKRLIVGLAALIMVLSSAACSGESPDREGEARMLASSSSYVGEHFEVAVEELRDAGFTDVEVKPLGDLITGWLRSDGEVKSIRIAGDDSFSEGDWFPSDTKIVISYHSFPEQEEAEEPSTAPTEASPESEPIGQTDAERSTALDTRLREIFGGVGSMTDLLLDMPTSWPGYVVGVRVERDLAYFTLQVDRNSADGKRLGEDAAQALSTLFSKLDLKDISWLIVEDGAGVVIDQKQPNPIQ